ncbi:terpene cyclase [Salix suchowensis]|nr:terpene cyclase [Salix suchowensis]
MGVRPVAGETSKYFDGAQASLIIASTMNFVSSVALEHGIRQLEEIARIVNNLLSRCDLALSSTHIDDGFLQLCLEDATARGCPMEPSPGIPSFRPWNISGATIAYISYGHLESLPAKLFIALYTSLAVYIEDVYTDQPDLMNSFNPNFVTRQPQQTAVLQALDKLLGETSNTSMQFKPTSSRQAP